MLAEHVPDEDGARAGSRPRCSRLLGVGEPPTGGRRSCSRAWRTFFERIAAQRHGGPGLRGPALGRPGTARLHRPPARVVARTVPIFIITLARPELLERRPDWGAGRRNFIAPRPRAARRADDARAARGPRARPPGGGRRGRSSSAPTGIPLYAVETVRMLVADGRLRRARTAATCPVGDLGDARRPRDAARAHRRAPRRARRRPIGRSSRTPRSSARASRLAGAGRGLGRRRDAIEPRLRVAGPARAPRATTLDPRSPERGQYAFVQALIREVAYNTLAKRDRRARHLAAARFFESLGDDELAGALAGHYLAGLRGARPRARRATPSPPRRGSRWSARPTGRRRSGRTSRP